MGSHGVGLHRRRPHRALVIHAVTLTILDRDALWRCLLLLTVSEGSACPGWKPKHRGSVLHEGIDRACILAELEAEMGELEDFFFKVNPLL